MNISDLQGTLNDMENGTYDFTKNGECTCCGNCCSNLLPMTDDEISIIKQYIKSHGVKEQKRNFLNANIDLTCPFLDDSKEKKCTIYEVRPRVCRDFICCPEKRPPVDFKFAMQCRPINVRSEFF